MDSSLIFLGPINILATYVSRSIPLTCMRLIICNRYTSRTTKAFFFSCCAPDVKFDLHYNIKDNGDID